MGRRRRKAVKIIRRRLPEFYLCPRCGKNTVRATIKKKQDQVVVVCGSCGLKANFQAGPQMAEVDAYCLFVDGYYNPETQQGETKVG